MSIDDMRMHVAGDAGSIPATAQRRQCHASGKKLADLCKV